MKDLVVHPFEGMRVPVPDEAQLWDRRFYLPFWRQLREELPQVGSHMDVYRALGIVDVAYAGGASFIFPSGLSWEPPGAEEVFPLDPAGYLKTVLKAKDASGELPRHQSRETERLLYLSAFLGLSRQMSRSP